MEAIELYRKAIVLGADSPLVFNNMGLCYFRKNRFVLVSFAFNYGVPLVRIQLLLGVDLPSASQGTSTVVP